MCEFPDGSRLTAGTPVQRPSPWFERAALRNICRAGHVPSGVRTTKKNVTKNRRGKIAKSRLSFIIWGLATVLLTYINRGLQRLVKGILNN